MLELLAALAKFAVYASCFAAAGIVFADVSLAARRPAQSKRLIIAAAVALGATLAGALILIARLGGQIDGATLSAIWETPAGLAIVLQLVGASLLLVLSKAAGQLRFALIGAALCTLASFGVNGHAASVGVLPGAIAFLQVCAASWWLGSLLLLRDAVHVLPAAELTPLVRRFSRFALAIVGVLLVCGFLLTWTLIDFNRAEWLTPYAQGLALKIVLAASVMGIAAYNKLRITPRLALQDGTGARALNQTIGMELGVFAAVLLATAWLTTFNSPHA